MTHAPGCSKPPPWRDNLKPGWVRIKCPECKHVGNVPITAPKATPAPKPSPTATGYRCRDHHDQPVTWRGKGCSRCAADLKRRKAPTARDDYEEAYR